MDIKNTDYLKLELPLQTDYYDVDIVNSNNTKIDKGVELKEDKIAKNTGFNLPLGTTKNTVLEGSAMAIINSKEPAFNKNSGFNKNIGRNPTDVLDGSEYDNLKVRCRTVYSGGGLYDVIFTLGQVFHGGTRSPDLVGISFVCGSYSGFVSGVDLQSIDERIFYDNGSDGLNTTIHISSTDGNSVRLTMTPLQPVGSQEEFPITRITAIGSNMKITK